ncbi:MAG: xanthine dehydrogenase accessory protein XdhC [candidate division Zixibacteria bacterium]|nr:xanthine dehydrogenase accessory protein XdhC [candidate division Zixibacteria bacterium]
MDLFKEISENQITGKAFVLAMVVKTVGSTPRDMGAKMLVYPDGSISGTIGGGTLEHLVAKECLAMIRDNNQHLLKSYKLNDSSPDATGMACGGEAEVFMELFRAPDKLIIFGGGHIGRALAKIADDLAFNMIVVDDRQEVLDNYKPSIETVLTDENFSSELPSIDKNSYIVIVTHGHKCDLQVLTYVLKHDCAYLGMIGSTRKVKKTFEELAKSGVKESLLEKVHAPIGLDIGAEGPYEIAVAIAAELIASQRRILKDESE